ncbi:MAG: hypothetical protein ACKVIM_08665 [Flavobacteriales bacterium]|jgi:membrane-bound metal-dependent hydrolase YbcI (DUF457 family)|tara:strand:- start:279 stop:491 length:213 start_codon:yes stop_codon:yes gene_type:complete
MRNIIALIIVGLLTFLFWSPNTFKGGLIATLIIYGIILFLDWLFISFFSKELEWISKLLLQLKAKFLGKD